MTPTLHPEEAVDLAHPFGVAAGEVVVHRDDVDAVAGERVEIDRQGGDEGLALAGLHLGDLALVQHHPADQLHVEMAQPERAARGLAHHGEGFGQELVERRIGGQALAELDRLGGERFVGEGGHCGLQRVDLGHPPAIGAERAFVAGAEDLAGKGAEHEDPSRLAGRRGGRLAVAAEIGLAPSRVNASAACGLERDRRRWMNRRRPITREDRELGRDG